MLRHQVARLNKERGTVYSQWRNPQVSMDRKGQWQSCITMMEDSLAYLAWSMDADKPSFGAEGRYPEGGRILMCH